jgi:hypothetical protein
MADDIMTYTLKIVPRNISKWEQFKDVILIRLGLGLNDEKSS